MSKISELGPITGANTRSEDLFVIVNLIQGDDGTKNITRKELVAAIQYEIFDRITITGGSISNVVLFNSTLNDNIINDSQFNDGTIDGSAITSVTIDDSDFSNGTGNNNIFTNTIVDQSTITNSDISNTNIVNSDFSDGTGNNVVLTNSQIDDSLYNNVTIEQGTANGLILTNITIDELILEDALISNSNIITTNFSNGSIFDTDISNSDIRDTDLDNVDITNSRFSNGQIWDTLVSNSVIINTDLDDVDITNSRFSNGQIWDTDIANSNIDNVVISGSTFTDGALLDSSANNLTITTSDFSNGTGDNNEFTNTTLQGTLQDSVIANSSFQGTMDDVVATNMTIGSSSSEDLLQQRSRIENSDFLDGAISNTTIDSSTLVDFDMDIKKVFEPPIDEDSYFALKNVQTGETERMTYRQLYDEFSRKTEKSLKVHVASDGDDRNDGTLLKPVRTLKRAEELALEKAGGSYDRNDINNAVHISVGPGTYYVDEPIMLPDDCSMTSTAGQYATVIQKKPGWERTNGVLVGSGCYVQGFSYMNFEVDNFDQPEGGFAIAYRPGALLRRSPYLRDSSQLSNFNRLDVEPPLNPFNSKGTILDLGQEFYLEPGHSPQSQFEVDDEVTFSSGASGYISHVDDIDSNRQIYVRNLKGNVQPGDMLYAQRGGTGTVQSIGIDDFPNRLVGRGGGCLLADRAVLDTDSLYTYVLCFGFTPRTQNGTGYVAKNGAGVNGIGSLSIFTRQAFFALDGGQMTLNNSGSQFGDISMRARGSTVIIRPADGNSSNLIADTTFADTIEASKEEIIDDMIDYLTSNTSTGYNGNPGLGYQGYNADKCFRDTGIIVDNTGYDIATNGNYWGRLNGITYRSPISYVVVNEQLNETVGSIEHLKDYMNFIFENAASEVRDRVNTSINETLNVLQNGEEFANNIIFTDTGNGPATAARELVQDNREFIIEEFIDWLDNNEEFYAYDSTKCKRDVREFILPAVKYDTLLDTNYNSVTAGNAYYFKAAKNVIGAQREETIAAYERLRKTTDNLVEPISKSFAVEAYEKFNEIINILKMEGDKFTPTAATYEPTTGVFVMTIPAHGLEVGRYILLSPESFTFTCATDGNQLEFKHPRKTDPAFKSALPIIAATTDTITVNVGSTGYNGVHTLTKVANDAVIVLGSAIEFSDNSSIPADRRNARKQLQANREFIQDYMMNWADNEWFFYDSAKCQRDMKNYIVPAVLRDMQTGTNFNSIQSGIAYRSGIARVAVNEQLTETIGAIDFLKQETANTVSDPVVIQRIDDGFDEIINIARNNSKKYTPTNATYDPVTGIMVVTIGSHDFQLGDTVIIEQEGITFECGSPAVQISHPRVTDPAYNTPLSILARTSTTITLNVGDANGYTGAHTFVSAITNAIREADIYDGKFTPQDATYDPISGDMTITIGQHNLPVGKWISIADESITFECANTVANTIVEISHPRATDPAFRQPVRITGVTSNSITVNVANANGYTGEHTFVSAAVDCIDTNAIYWTDPAKIDSFHTPSDATYDPATGEMVITLGLDHGFTTDDHIEFKPQSVVFSCANTVANTTVEISHPRIGEPNYQMPLEITAVSNTTITVNPGAVPGGYTGAHTFVSAEEGSVIKTPAGVTREGKAAAIKLQENRTFLQDEVDAWIRDNYFVYKEDLCFRDTGLILDAVRRDMATGSNINAVFAGLAYRSGNASTTEVVTNQLTETVGAITWLKGQVQGITSGTGQTRADAAFDEIIDIMQNGTGAANTVFFGTSYVSEDALAAKEALQANKSFLQAEVTAWIANTHPSLVYNVADCERDLGYFIDAISWDVQHGSNAATLKNARLYFDNAVGVLADEEKPITAEAYKHIGKLAGMIIREEAVTPDSASSQTFNASNTAITPTTATYDPVTGVLVVTVASHTLEVGDYVVIEEGGITFECGSPAVQISHPRATDPYFNTPIRIDAVTATTLTMQVGNAGGYTGAHTFVSALTDAIRPSVAPSVAKEVVDLFEAIGNIVLEDNFVETFTNAGVGTGIPQIKEPTLVGTGYDAAINSQYERIAGATGKYQREIIDYIREEYNGLGFDTDLCYRDTGLIVDAITEDMEYGGDAAAANAASFYFRNAVSILPYDQREPTRLAFEHLADVIEDVVQGNAVTPTTGNTTTQITAGLVANATTALRAKNLTNIVSSTVDNRLVIPDYTGSLDISQQVPEALPTANTDISPLIEPSRTFARKSLQMNKAFIQDEVVAFINDKYFVYNEDKCARDVGYILDAVKRDIQTGSDYPSKYAGRAYRAGNAGTDIVINEQLAETIEAIKYLRRDIEPRLSGTALTRATTAFDNIINIMKNGTVGLTYSNWGTANVGNSDAAATDGLQLNRAFLAAEGKAYFQQTYNTLWNSLTVAQRDKCERDIGYLVDAVSFDIRHGSNVAMRDVARLYFENGQSVLPVNQKTETAGVFAHVAAVAEQVVLKQPVTPTAGNGVSQVLSGFGNVVAATGIEVENLFNIVTNIILEDSLINMPTAQEPNVADPAANGYDQEASVAIVNGRIATLAANINTYLQETFDYLEYNQVKCRRDVGYMVDAISHDIQYGGNAAMWNAAQIYFVNMTNLLPLDQRDATREAFTRMANVIHDVIRNETVVKSSGNSSVQDMSNLTARRETALEAKNLGLMVANIADDNNPDNLPSRIEPETAWMPAIVKTEKDKVDNELETLVTSMINFISTEYNGISYQKEKCRRDVGIIIDALSHDVQYRTNYATRLCANMYFDNATSVLPFDQRTQTADFYVVMADLVKDIVQELAAGQDTSADAATAVEGEWVADMVRIIEEAIRRDGLDALPSLVEPDTSWIDANEVAAGEVIDSQLNELADDVTQFIADNFTIVDYSKAKCRRDSGYILDAMSWDLNYGGNLASRWNADFYYWNNELRIPENTREATAKSYRKLGEIVSKVVVGQYPGQLLRPELGSEEQSTQAYDLGMIFYNALFYNTPKALGPTIKPNFEWEADPTFRFAKDILNNNRTKLQREVQRFITSEYKFIDLPKTYRDAGNLLKILANDFRFIDPSLGTEGSDKATRSFVGALFNINAQHVFPVFNPPLTFTNWRRLRFKGTVENATARNALTGMKRWDAYIIPINNNGNRYIGEIWYWNGTAWASAGNNNTDLLESFVGAWEAMRDYINTNVATTTPQRTMITELIDNVLIDSVIRPNFLTFGSLVESIAHQFNGASAGVNRNALPLNFRNVGAAIGANASVLSENGGRIRWSGSDELNNQYFARGLRINGRTGRIEGRPFTSSVRKLARRASNSRASL